MFGIKSNLRVGLDVGSHSVKVVLLERAGNKNRLVDYRIQPIYRGEEAYSPDGARNAQIVPLLLEMFYELGLAPKRVKFLATSVGGHSTSAKEIASLHMSEEEMASAFLLEARKHLPLDGSETVVDYQVIGDDPKDSEKVRVLLVATTKKTFEAHLDLLREVELTPGVIDLEQLAAVNSYMLFSELPEDGVAAFLNIGCRKTTLVIVGRKDMFFTRDLPVAGMHFTSELMKSVKWEYKDAESHKLSHGMSLDGIELPPSVEAGIKLAEKPVLEKFGDELNRSLRFYVKETNQGLFSRFVLGGGSAMLPELKGYLEERFNIPVEVHNPFKNIDMGGKSVSNPPQLSAAVGLALRGSVALPKAS
jgi:type IV pilus assembly protein PilM